MGSDRGHHGEVGDRHSSREVEETGQDKTKNTEKREQHKIKVKRGLTLMEMIMRNGLFQTALCLVGISSPVNCQVNWKNGKNIHHQLTQQQGKTISTTEDLTYFANNLINERNFVKNLDTILIPRTVGSEGSRKVRNHIIKEMRRVGWSVDQHAFEDNTPFGKYTFTNVIATLNPDAPRRYSYSIDLQKDKLSCNFSEWSLLVTTTQSWSLAAGCLPVTLLCPAP